MKTRRLTSCWTEQKVRIMVMATALRWHHRSHSLSLPSSYLNVAASSIWKEMISPLISTRDVENKLTEASPRSTPPTAPPRCTCTGLELTMDMTDTSQAPMATMATILPRLLDMDTLTPTWTTSRVTATARVAMLGTTQCTPPTTAPTMFLTTLPFMLLIMLSMA